MKPETQTPRTDAVKRLQVWVGGSLEIVGADFARQLERELTTATEKAERLERALRLILPMAKGYAHANPVGSNAEYVAEAEEALNPEKGG